VCQEQISDSTKEQRGRGRIRNNGKETVKAKLSSRAVMKEQGLGTCVFTRKDHTNRDLARSDGQVSSRTQTVIADVSVGLNENQRGYQGLQHRGPMKVEWDRSSEVQARMQEGIQDL